MRHRILASSWAILLTVLAGSSALAVTENTSASDVISSPGASSQTRNDPIGWGQRVACQQAIEEVYWRHRIWPEQNPGPKPSLASVMSEAQIAARVEDGLKKSNALEIYWSRPITAAQLEAEVRRMARESRDPELLRELFASLGNDSRLIAECLARPVLADRLVRHWFAADDPSRGPQEGSPDDVFGSWWAQIARSIPASLISMSDPVASLEAPAITAAPCSPDTWSTTRFLPNARSGHVAVWTGSEMLVWGAITFADGSIPGGRYVPATDTWRPITSRNHPSNRTNMAAVWTGTEMIVWGGWGTLAINNDYESGGRYNPQTDSWTPTSIGPGVPTPRDRHSAVWTGTEMIVWGGNVHRTTPGNTGARYNPGSDSWMPTSTVGAPSARAGHNAVWTGSRMVIWGSNVITGGRYDPVTDSWSPTSTTGAPEARTRSTAVWTGTRMIVWGGCSTTNGCFTRLNTGGSYDPSADSWSPLSTSGSPLERFAHTAIWTGSRMIVWGGCLDSQCTSQSGDGGRYDPVANAWSPVTVAGGPGGRAAHSAVWSGTEMIVWGGCYGGECQLVTNTGGRYNPATDSWVPTSVEDAASPRLQHTAVWTGSEMIVWGGFDSLGQTYTGKRYNPATDHWTMTNFLGNPGGRDLHTAVWTGTEMIVWGGRVVGIGAHNSGGRYNPTTDTWSDTSFTDAPSARQSHESVWTGSRMIVWGGCADSFCASVFDTGGRYNPSTDSWQATSTVNAPPGRWFGPAVWTGSEMIVWGGRLGNGSPDNTGGRYNPVSDSWSATSAVGAPGAREGHAGVWSGSDMIVWGGQNATGVLGDGARYRPSTNSWTAISGVSAPQARSQPSVVWTGDRMVVWGGCTTQACDAWHFTGGQYLPASDSWMATSTGAFTPFDRYKHTAVWSGTQVLVWGGWRTGNGTQTNTGAAYCPGPGGVAVHAPSAPSGVTATGVSSQIDISWLDNSSDESGFKIDRCLGDLAWCTANAIQYFSWIGSVGPDLTAFTDTTRQSGVAYSYRVRASNAGGDSGHSNIASATTTDAAPAAPSNLTATAISTTQVNPSWSDNSANEQGFNIERCSGTGTFCDSNPTNYVQIAQTGADATSYSDMTAHANTTYAYRARAFNSTGSSPYSNTASVTTPGSNSPGEASKVQSGSAPLLVTGYNQKTGRVTVTFAPACAATGHVAYSGPLAQVNLLKWDRAVCSLGTTGTATFDPGTGSRYFVIVGQGASAEGSYGRRSDGTERPEAAGGGTCDLPQNLSNSCP